MKALVVEEFGPWQQAAVREVPDPEPGSAQVLIGVRAAGINFPDILMMQGEYQFKPPTPFVPGVEGAGVIEQVGAEVEGWSVGDAAIFISDTGAFAEQIAIEPARLIRMPPGLEFSRAAGLAMIYGTSYHALKQRADLQPGETMLVLGAAGGVGSAAVQLGKAMGATVVAAVSSSEKADFARAQGADHTIDYAADDLRAALKEITSGAGPDVIYDPVGGPFAEPAFRSIAWGGRYLVVGFAAGDIPSLALNLPLLKGASIVGVFWGSFVARDPALSARNFADIASLLDEGLIDPPVSASYRLEDAKEALGVIAARQATGKLVLTM